MRISRSRVVGLLVLSAILLASCAPATTEVAPAPTQVVEEPTAVPSEPTVVPAEPTEGEAPAVAEEPTPVAFSCEGMDIVKGTLTPLVSYGHVYVAIEEGFFEKYCIQNEIEQVGLTVSFPLVAAGEYDWGRSSNGPGFYNALNEGLEIVGVVDRLTYTCSGDNVLVISPKAEEEGVITFKDLKDRTVAIFARGSLSEYWLAQLLDRNGMTEEDINLVFLSFPDMASALSTGRIDAAFQAEPLATKTILEGTAFPLLYMGREFSGINVGMMMFGKQFLEKQDGDLAVRWLAAYLEGVRFAQDPANRDEVIRVVAEATDVEPEVVAEIYDNKFTWPQVDPNGYVDVDNMLSGAGEFFLGTGQIDELPAPEKIFDPTYLNKALEIVGTVNFDDYQLCKAP